MTGHRWWRARRRCVRACWMNLPPAAFPPRLQATRRSGGSQWYTSRALKLRLDYGTHGLDATVPDERVTIIEPIYRAAAPDAHATLLAAMRSPLGCRPLREIAQPGQRVA